MAGSDLSRLLKKGLTGWEVGILTIKDSIGVWQARKPAFTKAEYGQMKTSLRTAKDISDYNKLVNVLGVVEESHYVANIAELSALVDLGSLDDLTGYGLTRALFEMHLARIPKIVTQKQLEDLREAEREGVLGMTWTARELVEERAISLTKKAIPDYKYDIGAWEEIPEEDLPLFEKHLPRAEKEISKLTEGLKATKKGRERIFSGRDLYEAGMKEIREMADQSITWVVSREAHKLGLFPIRRVAVIQNPREKDIDEKGHYVDRHGPPFPDLGPTLADAIEHHEDGESLIPNVSKRVRDSIRTFFAIKAVLEQLSEVLETDLLESMSQWESRLKAGLDSYNVRLALLRDYFPSGKMKPIFPGECLPAYLQALPSFELEDLTPSKASINKVRERVSKILGEKWWMQDLLQTLEYPDGWTKAKVEEELGLTEDDLR